jgi:cytoskeletal protein CcmA (bactofilin family)
MALWKDSNPKPAGATIPGASSPAKEPAKDPAKDSAMPREPERINVTSLNPQPVPRVKDRSEMKESMIASDLSIEGKIVGSGPVRIAGRFKGDVHVDGNVMLDTGARLDGQVRADVVVVGGELHGNIEGARRVELLDGGVINGDVKAGSLTVAAGSRMRGQVEFGWEEDLKSAPAGNKGHGSTQ